MKYTLLESQVRSLAESERLWLPLLSNVSTLIYDTVGDVNWAGFYIVDGERLVLGPFKGQVACVSIGRGRGVCGTAWATGRTQSVPDVHAFAGHIACDSASRSEVVVPLWRDGQVVGVLDVDSTVQGRFSEADVHGLETVAGAVSEVVSWRPVGRG